MAIMDTDFDFFTFEDLDVECEALHHEKYGNGPAIALVTKIHPCCGYKNNYYFCAGCVFDITTSTKQIIHSLGPRPCGGRYTPKKIAVKKVEYL